MIEDGHGEYSQGLATMSKITVQRIKELMQRKGVTQAELSKRTHIAPAQINRYLSKTTPAGANLVKIADALGTNPSWLLDERRTYDGPITPDIENAADAIRRGDKDAVLEIARQMLIKKLEERGDIPSS